MNDIVIVLGLAGVFFGAMALRGVFGYLKNQKVSLDDIKFDWKKFVSGSLRPIALTIATGAVAGLVLAFLQLISATGLEVAGLDQISLQNFELALAIADIGAIGYALKEALLCYGLSDKQIEQIRETVAETGDGETAGIKVGLDKDGNIIASAETITKKTIKEQLKEDGVKVDDGEDLTSEVGKGAAYDNTYPEPYRSAPKDTLVDPSTCYNRECVSYCAWKICETTGAWLTRTGGMNAKDWIYRLPENGYNEVPAPTGNGNYVGVLPEGTYGHVVWWEGENVISEYNYGYAGNYGVRSVNLGQFRWYQIKAPSTPEPTPQPSPEPKKSNEEIADEVIRGDWGNGQERYDRLTQAGYDYNAIQAIVDAKLGGGTSDEFHVGDTVVPILLVDYYGTPLVQYDNSYTITELNGNRAVLSARGQIWAAMNTNNIRKV